MQAKTNQTKPKFGPNSTAGNPFARAFAESNSEKDSNSMGNGSKFGDALSRNSKDNNSFSQALANSGGGAAGNPDFDQRQMERQQEEAERKRKYDIQRRKLHDQINPVNMVDVFNAREERVKKEIDSIRYELKSLASMVNQAHPEIALTLSTPVSHPGQEGKYYISFFQQLRMVILLLRQRIQSAQTWANQMHSKKNKAKKKQGKFSAGIDMQGEAHEQTKSAHDMMHHENNMVYGG